MSFGLSDDPKPEDRSRAVLAGVATELRPGTSPAPRGRNLLDWRPLRSVMKSRLYPAVIQWFVLAVFVLTGYELIAGPSQAHQNFGTVLMWVIWWPLIPITFLFLGRFWCAVCPFATINDWVRNLVGAERPVPSFLKQYGIWIIDAAFIAITWADHIWGIVGSPWGSGVLVLLLTTAVIVSGALWQRRAFCKYLCFLGGVSGNYSRTSVVSLRADREICKTCTARAVCFNGSEDVPACPLSSFPRTLESSADCNLCANCIKNCPNDAIEITVRKPTSELWRVRKPRIEVAFLAMAIMGIVLLQNLTMLSVWPTILDWFGSVFGTDSYAVTFTAAFSVAIAMPVGALMLTSLVARRASSETMWLNFARFGYALIPLDVAAHVAHNLFHILSEGKAVVFTALPLFGGEVPTDSRALVGMNVIQVLQFTLLALGVLGSLYASYRMARCRYPTAGRRNKVLAPFWVLIVSLWLLNVWMFTIPMVHRV